MRKAVKEIFMVRPKKFGTRTDLALDLAAREVFTEAGGDRPKAKNVLIIVTDGKPHIPKKDKKTFIPFETSTKALEVNNENFISESKYQFVDDMTFLLKLIT